MKKLIVLVVALAVLAVFTAPASAKVPAKPAKEQAPKTETMNGKVSSINVPQNQIVVNDPKTGYSKVLVVKPEVYKTVAIGDEVQVTITSGTNVVEKIKVTKAAPKPAPEKTTVIPKKPTTKNTKY